MALRCIIWVAVSTAAQTDEDKYSLPSQEADALALAQREGWQVVDILRVPGHSRHYKSLDKLAADAAERGIDAFYRLIQHLESCDFDVLVTRDANRFARRASLLHYIVESVIEDCGARIYSLNDGWVDSTNADIFAMVKGYATAKEIKWLVEAGHRGKHKRMERGLPIGSKVPLSHLRIRDPGTGRDVGLEVNEALRPLWNALADLLLEGVAWTKIGTALYERYGFADASGRAYWDMSLYNLVLSPTFWGNLAQGYRYRRGQWVFDRTVAPPDGVTVAYGVVPPVYTGEQAERVKAELCRRFDIRGRSSPHLTYRYSGLLVCGECGRRLSVLSRPRGRMVGMRCPQPFLARTAAGGPQCTNSRRVNSAYLDAYFHRLLELRLAGETPPDMPPSPEIDRAADAAVLVTQLRARIERLIMEQSTAPEAIQPVYREQLGKLAEQLRHAEDNHRRLSAPARRHAQRIQEEAHTLDEIRAMTLAVFWSLPEREINQLLRRLMGRRRLVVSDRQIIGVTEG